MKVWIGWDPREQEAYDVCRFSIEKHTVLSEVSPLRQGDLRAAGLYWRPKDAAATDFSLTRFLVPRLQGYEGWALFCDCDFLFTADLAGLFALADDRHAAMVVKHNHQPTEALKMDGQVQAGYPRKNWSSLILWNCGHPKNANLTPEVVSTVAPSFLHQFQWLRDEEVGELPILWNFLVGFYKPPTRAHLPMGIHYTSGGPWFEGHAAVDYAADWRHYREEMEARK